MNIGDTPDLGGVDRWRDDFGALVITFSALD